MDVPPVPDSNLIAFFRLSSKETEFLLSLSSRDAIADSYNTANDTEASALRKHREALDLARRRYIVYAVTLDDD